MNFPERREHERRQAALRGWRATARIGERRKSAERAAISRFMRDFDAARVVSWDATGKRLVGKAPEIRKKNFDL